VCGCAKILDFGDSISLFLYCFLMFLFFFTLTTLWDRVDNRISIDVTKSGPDPLLSQLEEARLVKHLIYMSNLGYGYTRSQADLSVLESTDDIFS
jgi:hypothetical protein